MRCIHFRIRSKDYTKLFYCVKERKEIDLKACNKCSSKIYKFVKPMRNTTPLKKITKKQAKAERDRFSLFTDDLTKCIICGKSPVNKHEIFYGSGKRQLSIKYGLVVPFCTCEHHNQYECKGIHFDKELCKEWQIKGQLMFMKHYNKTKDEFRKIFGRNYLE